MTHQIRDSIKINEQCFSIVASARDEHGGAGYPFRPADVAIKTGVSSTACWHGYHALFELRSVDLPALLASDVTGSSESAFSLDSSASSNPATKLTPNLLSSNKSSLPHLQLARLEVVADDELPVLNGVAPTPIDSRPYLAMFTHRYDELKLALAYSGGLLVSGQPLDWYDAYRSSPFCCSYRQTLELIFDEGKLVSARDVSALIDAWRPYHSVRYGEKRAIVRAFKTTFSHRKPCNINSLPRLQCRYGLALLEP